MIRHPPDLAERPEVGQQQRQCRLDLIQQSGRLVGGTGPPLLQHVSHLRIVGFELLGDPPRRLRAHVPIASIDCA